MAVGLGLTKYGFGVTYIMQNSTDTVARTYNGVNFANDTALSKADYLQAFVMGRFDQRGEDLMPSIVGLAGICSALGLQGIAGYEVIQRNAVTQS